jgi:hypothetical protein
MGMIPSPQSLGVSRRIDNALYGQLETYCAKRIETEIRGPRDMCHITIDELESVVNAKIYNDTMTRLVQQINAAGWYVYEHYSGIIERFDSFVVVLA